MRHTTTVGQKKDSKQGKNQVGWDFYMSGTRLTGAWELDQNGEKKTRQGKKGLGMGQKGGGEKSTKRTIPSGKGVVKNFQGRRTGAWQERANLEKGSTYI